MQLYDSALDIEFELLLWNEFRNSRPCQLRTIGYCSEECSAIMIVIQCNFYERYITIRIDFKERRGLLCLLFNRFSL